MERTGTVIIAKTEYVILGGSEKALEQAFLLAGKSHRVTVLAEGACLGFYDEKNGETPDVYQHVLEDTCEKLGIEVIYFMRFVDSCKVHERTLVRAASKGGLYGVLCDVCVDCRIQDGEERCLALITEEGKEGFRILEAQTPKKNEPSRIEEGSAARRLLECRTKLVESFLEEKAYNPKLMLGRFMGRTYSYRNEKTLESDCEAIFTRGHDHFCRYDFLEQSAEEASVHAAVEHCDLLVAGGGTAGVMAALHGARNGLHTVLVEPNYDLGGTQTIGGVTTYWFGHRYSDVREIDEEVNRLCDACGVKRRTGIWSEKDDFHGGLRSLVYLKLCLEAGVKVILGQIAYDVICESAAGAVECEKNIANKQERKQEKALKIRGVLTAGESGNILYCAKAVIDATGDGDLAIAAGADGCYGSEEDMITYWGSLAQYTSPDTYQNNFSSMLFAEDPLDYSRFIRLGRKRGEKPFDHGNYVSMRESRHIRGVHTITLRDLITYRTYSDALYTCYSNYDPKGKLDADMVYCGVLPPQISIQIPLSALTPVDKQGRRIRGLYVGGKAISATHNVFPSIRMQPDLMHQGSVLGALLGKALRTGRYPEELTDAEQRSFLVQYTDDPLKLPEVVTDAPTSAKAVNKDSRSHWVDADFVFEETGFSPTLGVMAGGNDEAVKENLRLRLNTETDRELREQLIGYALWYGMDDWTEELCDRVLEKLQGDLPVRAGSTMCAQLLPDHGVMPEVVYQLNQLGWSQNPAIIQPFERVLYRLERNERDYLAIQKGIYTYIEAFAYAAVHSGRKEFIPMLHRLLEFPELKFCVNSTDSTELMTERFQILVFILNRALAMLGDREGYRGLAQMLAINNMAICGSVSMTLHSLLGIDHGLQQEMWMCEIAKRETFPCRRKITKIW